MGLKSPSTIVEWLKKQDLETFGGLTKQSVDGWIDKSGPTRRWKDNVLRWAEHGNDPGHSKGGQRGVLVRFVGSHTLSLTFIQANYPHIIKEIKSRLATVQEGKAPLSTPTV